MGPRCLTRNGCEKDPRDFQTVMPYRFIQVGAGGFGGAWCSRFLPPSIADGLIDVVAVVDIDPATHANAVEHLGVPPERCYTDLDKALDENPADVCTVVVPPAHHESVVEAALARGLHILSEKPIADTLEGSIRIAETVKAAGVKMGVTMSHRFDQDKTTLRRLVRSGEFGELDYLVCRFTSECRKFGSWGVFRHQIPDALMVEGAVHHLDLLADLAGAPCKTIYAQTWNPRWGEYEGDSQGLVTMTCENGTRIVYEGAKTNAVGLNSWGHEYIRAECEAGTLIMNAREIKAFHYLSHLKGRHQPEQYGEVIPLLQQPKWSNAWLIEKFVAWLDGGEPMETNVEDNLQSVALIFAAIHSNRTGQPVQVQEFLQEARDRVRGGK